MTPIKRHCQFLVDKEKGKEDGRLRYRIKWNGEVVAFNVGYRVYLSKWSKETQRCVANTTHGRDKISASEINRVIQIMEEDIASIFYKYEMTDAIPTKENIRRDYNILIGKNTEEQEQNVQKLFKLFIQTEAIKKSWTRQTIAKLNVIRRHLKRFNSQLSIDKINEDILQEFITYLIYDKKLRNSTAKKHYRFVLWFLHWANEQKYYFDKSYINFKPKFKGTSNQKEVIYLTRQELMKLYEYDFSNQISLDQVRDVFCFCCFTGLRYSDAAKLTKEDIYTGYIELVTQKTVDRLQIDLNKYSQRILDKHKNKNYPNGLALPIISNQKMNDHLKTIGKRIQLNTPIKLVYYIGNKRIEEIKPKHDLLTTHCGRRTFVVNALYLEIPAEVIMRWTGHSNFAAMKPYVKIVDELKRKEMNKFDNLLGP